MEGKRAATSHKTLRAAAEAKLAIVAGLRLNRKGGSVAGHTHHESGTHLLFVESAKRTYCEIRAAILKQLDRST